MNRHIHQRRIDRLIIQTKRPGFDWVSVIVVLFAIIMASHMYTQWRAKNVAYEDRYGECLEHYSKVHEKATMIEIRELCDAIIIPNPVIMTITNQEN